MKKIVAIVLCVISNYCFSQNLIFTSTGFIDTSTKKDYVVLSLNDRNKDVLYNNTLLYLKTLKDVNIIDTFKNSDIYHISYNRYDTNITIINNEKLNINYNIMIYFRDNKIRLDIINIEVFGISNIINNEFKITYNIIDNDISKKDIENYFNKNIIKLKENVF